MLGYVGTFLQHLWYTNNLHAGRHNLLAGRCKKPIERHAKRILSSHLKMSQSTLQYPGSMRKCHLSLAVEYHLWNRKHGKVSSLQVGLANVMSWRHVTPCGSGSCGPEMRAEGLTGPMDKMGCCTVAAKVLRHWCTTTITMALRPLAYHPWWMRIAAQHDARMPPIVKINESSIPGQCNPSRRQGDHIWVVSGKVKTNSHTVLAGHPLEKRPWQLKQYLLNHRANIHSCPQRWNSSAQITQNGSKD